MYLQTLKPSMASSSPIYSLIVKSSQTPSIQLCVTELTLLPDPPDNVVDLNFAFVNNS